MLLQLHKTAVPMKLVYLRSEALKNDPQDVADTQALTLNEAKPLLGLKGTHGLYGSSKWWRNIQEEKMPLVFTSGLIQRVYAAGMDSGEQNNSFDLLLDDGSICAEGIYVNNSADVALFRVGCRVEMVSVLDEFKLQPGLDGDINYLKIPLEFAVSLEPV